MPTDTAELEANLDASCLLVLFIPSEQGTEDHAPIDQEYWVGQALDTLGLAFGGATAFPKGQGV